MLAQKITSNHSVNERAVLGYHKAFELRRLVLRTEANEHSDTVPVRGRSKQKLKAGHKHVEGGAVLARRGARGAGGCGGARGARGEGGRRTGAGARRVQRPGRLQEPLRPRSHAGPLPLVHLRTTHDDVTALSTHIRAGLVCVDPASSQIQIRGR